MHRGIIFVSDPIDILSSWLIIALFGCREVPGTDVSSSVETDKENDSTMASDGEVNTTDQLLDSTYNLKPASVMYGKSPIGK